MKKLTVRDYAREFELSESAVRKQLRAGKLAFTKELINNRETTLIIVEKFPLGAAPDTIQSTNNNKGTVPKFESTVPPQHQENSFNENIQEAEIVGEATNYNLVSMENDTFEKLIQNIKDIADDRSKTEKESYVRLEKEFFELKAKCLKLEDENKQLIIENAQNQSNIKITELRFSELQSQSKKEQHEFERYKDITEREKRQLKEEIATLKQQLLNNENKLKEVEEEKQSIINNPNNNETEKSFWALFSNNSKL